MLWPPRTQVIDARWPQLFKSTRPIPAEAVPPIDTSPAMLNAGKDYAA
jgi:hypothetical protein